MAWLKWRKHLIWAPKVFNYFTWHGRQFLIFDFLSTASPPWDWHLIFSPIYHRDVWFGTPSLSEDKEQLNAPARWPSSWWPPPSLIFTEGRRVTLHCHNLKRREKWPGIFFFWACYVRSVTQSIQNTACHVRAVTARTATSQQLINCPRFHLIASFYPKSFNNERQPLLGITINAQGKKHSLLL